MKYVAAIDIGSNAIRLAIARLLENQIHISYRSREPVRLGSSVFSHGSIDASTYEELKRALVQFGNQMKNHNVQQYRAIATSAMREASNGQEVIDNLAQETGIPVELISGEEEARLVSVAISQKIDLQTGSHLLIDIGGGSIELIAIIDGEVQRKKSFGLGMVRILERQKQETTELKDWFPKVIQNETQSFFKDLPPMDQAVGTGGNMDRFIKLKSHVSQEPGEFLRFQEMQELYCQLEALSYNDRIEKFWLKPDRADVIIPAAIATVTLMEVAGSKCLHLPQVGLKDGLLYELSSESGNGL